MREKIVSFIILGVVVIGAGIAMSNLEKDSQVLKAEEVVGEELTQVRVGTSSFTVELAITDAQQAKGLSNRDSLEPGTGMLFVFDPAQQPSFWMKEMRFPLDLIWIYDNKVTKVSRNLPAPEPNTPTDQLPTYSPGGMVDYVLEVNAGEAASIEIGDFVEIVDTFQA